MDEKRDPVPLAWRLVLMSPIWGSILIVWLAVIWWAWAELWRWPASPGAWAAVLVLGWALFWAVRLSVQPMPGEDD